MTIDLYWAASLGKWVTIPDDLEERALTGGKRFYGDWIIYRDPTPFPSRACEWHFYHKDFDGTPDSNDVRCGTAASLADAVAAIRERENRA